MSHPHIRLQHARGEQGISAAWHEGERARHSGRPRSANPYRAHYRRLMALAWAGGWTLQDALLSRRAQPTR